MHEPMTSRRCWHCTFGPTGNNEWKWSSEEARLEEAQLIAQCCSGARPSRSGFSVNSDPPKLSTTSLRAQKRETHDWRQCNHGSIIRWELEEKLKEFQSRDADPEQIQEIKNKLKKIHPPTVYRDGCAALNILYIFYLQCLLVARGAIPLYEFNHVKHRPPCFRPRNWRDWKQ